MKPSEAILAYASEIADQGGVDRTRDMVLFATLKYLDHLVEQHEKANERRGVGWHVECRCAFCTVDE